MDRNQVHIRLDPETSRKLQFVLDHGATITGLFKNAVVNTYSELTDTVRVPITGKIESNCVFFGTDTKYE